MTGSEIRATLDRNLDYDELPSTFPNRNYDITHDGKQLLIQVPDPTNLRSREVDVVLNWFEELKRRVQTR